MASPSALDALSGERPGKLLSFLAFRGEPRASIGGSWARPSAPASWSGAAAGRTAIDSLLSFVVLWASILAGCSPTTDAPSPAPTVPAVPTETQEATLTDEFVRAILPPPWEAGQTWTVETHVPIRGLDAEEGRVEISSGLAHFRVVERTDELALVQATATTDRSADAYYKGTWTLTFVLEPFHLRDFEFSGRVARKNLRDRLNAGWTERTNPEPLTLDNHWTVHARGIVDTEVMFVTPTQADHLPAKYWFAGQEGFEVLPGFGCWWWGDGLGERYVGLRMTRWLPGDPWWVLNEGISYDGRVRSGREAPARGRLVAVDGEEIEPWPWTDEDLPPLPAMSPLDHAAAQNRCWAAPP